MRRGVLSALIWILTATSAAGQASQFALRFYGTGVGPPGQQDRVLFPVDDNAPGPGGNTPIDVGGGSFTIELWLRGNLADNPSANAGGDVESFSYNWIEAHIFLDRDVWCGTANAFGASLAGGFVRFGSDRGDSPPFDSVTTIEGDVDVLDGAWHHVALVRDVATGIKAIYVDGALDFAGSPGITFTDLSYPDAGIPVTPEMCNPGQLTPFGWFLVLAAEKHDAGANFPSFSGYADELRIWSTARTPAQIAATWNRLVPTSSPGLVAAYRFEEGSGTMVSDSSAAGSPPGDLRGGVAGNGEWVSFADDPSNTAPLVDLSVIFSDGFESGDLAGWDQTAGGT